MSTLLQMPCNQEEINKLKAQCGLTKVTMLGMIEDLGKIKEMIEQNYDAASYMDYDIEYHGWDGEAARNIHNVADAITNRMREIYAICLVALGE